MNGHISTIDPDRPDTYPAPFLTFDIDWAHDAIIEDTLGLLKSADAQSTWFVTHPCGPLATMREDPSIELGIHPNFNFLLEGRDVYGTSVKEVTSRFLEIVPGARSVRSHSITQSSRISDVFRELGLTHESNDFIPEDVHLALRPWAHHNNLIKVPYFWSDELACVRSSSSMADLVARPGLRVFDFHPIHVFLNTENLSRYERTRDLHNNPRELIRHRFEGKGTRSRLIELLQHISIP